MDVRITFLNGDLVEDVYMSQPTCFEEVGKENMVCLSSLMKLSLPMVLRITLWINAYI